MTTKKTKIKAFTIMEVVVAMLLSAVVISITYTAYGIISRSYLSFTIKNEEMSVYLSLDKLLKRDFSRADQIVRTSDGIFLKNEKDSVTYTFHTDAIIRSKFKTDTFKVNSAGIETAFENTVMTTAQNPVDRLVLSLLLHDRPITFEFYKPYSSEELFNQKPYALH